MTIDLSKVEFVNDFFTVSTPDGGTLTLNKIDESLRISEYTRAVTEETAIDIKAINVVYESVDNNIVKCPCVIGLGNDLLSLSTNYTELEGKVLTSDNMKYCTLTVYES